MPEADASPGSAPPDSAGPAHGATVSTASSAAPRTSSAASSAPGATALGAMAQTLSSQQVTLGEVSRILSGTPIRLPTPWERDFGNLAYEWRRIFAELVGTFFLVLVAAGAVTIGALYKGSVSNSAEVVAPGLMVMAVILAIGAVSGAHLNPVVTIAFLLRDEFPLRRVPLYIVAQVGGALLACLFLWAMFGKAGHLGATLPGAHISDVKAMWIEAVLTCGLVTTILGTASGAQNVGPLSAIAVAGYISLAGLWAGPVTGASMNPARSLGPQIVGAEYAHLWVYLAGPTIGMLVAVAFAYVLRGPGGDPTAVRAAQGTLSAYLSVRPSRRQTPLPESSAGDPTTPDGRGDPATPDGRGDPATPGGRGDPVTPTTPTASPP